MLQVVVLAPPGGSAGAVAISAFVRARVVEPQAALVLVSVVILYTIAAEVGCTTEGITFLVAIGEAEGALTDQTLTDLGVELLFLFCLGVRLSSRQVKFGDSTRKPSASNRKLA